MCQIKKEGTMTVLALLEDIENSGFRKDFSEIRMNLLRIANKSLLPPKKCSERYNFRFIDQLQLQMGYLKHVTHLLLIKAHKHKNKSKNIFINEAPGAPLI